MEKLNKENIEFINTYLENSDIIYADIRMEMVDHVASKIEAKIEAGDTRSFYNIFKDYMVENKASLLLNNRQFLKDTDKAISKQILKLLISPKIVVLFIFLLLLLNYVLPGIDKIWLSNLVLSVPFLSITPLIVLYGVLRYVYKVSRFSGIERIALFFTLFFNLFNSSSIFLRKALKETVHITVVTVICSLAITFAVALTIVGYNMIVKYKNKYKALV